MYKNHHEFQEISKIIYQFAQTESFIDALENRFIEFSGDPETLQDEQEDNYRYIKQMLLTNNKLLKFIETVPTGPEFINKLENKYDNIIYKIKYDEPILKDYINELIDIYIKKYPQDLLIDENHYITMDDLFDIYPNCVEDFLDTKLDDIKYDYNYSYFKDIILDSYESEYIIDFINAVKENKNPFQELDDDGDKIFKCILDNLAYDYHSLLKDFLDEYFSNLGLEFYENISKEKAKQMFQNTDIISEICSSIIENMDYEELYKEVRDLQADEEEQYEYDPEQGVTHIKQLLDIDDKLGDTLKMVGYFETNNRELPFTIVSEYGYDFVIWGEQNSMHGESISEYIPEIKADGSLRPSDSTITQYKDWESFGFGHYGNEVAVIEEETLHELSLTDAVDILLTHKEHPITKVYSAPGHGKSGKIKRIY